MFPVRAIQIYTDGGPWACHDQPCAVCQVKHAVLDLHTQIFLPCGGCQAKGYQLRFKPRRWWRR